MTAHEPVLPRRSNASPPSTPLSPACGMGLNALFPVGARLPADMQALLAQLAHIPAR